MQYWDWSLWSSNSDYSSSGYGNFYDLDDDGTVGSSGWMSGGWSGGCLYLLRIALWPASLANQLRSACTWPSCQPSNEDDDDDMSEEADGFWDTSHGQLYAPKRLEVELAAGVALVVLGVSDEMRK